MAFVKPPARNMPPGSEPWAQWVEEQMSSVTKKSVEAYQYAERAAGGVNSALEGNVQNWDEINRVFEVTENSMQLADGAVVWSTLDPELPEDVPINPNVIWYTHDPETREVLRMWQWGYYDDVEGVYVEDWYQAQLGADSIHDEAITSAKVALNAIDWDQIGPGVTATVNAAQEKADKAAADLLIEKDRVNAELGPVKGDLSTLKTTTIPALQTTLNAANAEVTTLKNTTIPALRSDLTASEGKVATLQNTTIPSLQTALTNVEGAAQSADKRSTVSTAAPSATTGFPQNAVWQRINASGAVIGSWRLSGSSWVQMPLDPVVIPNLSAGIITSGVINTNRLNAQEIAAASGQFLSLSAGQITSGKINTDRLTASEVAAAVGSFLSLSAGQITSGTINTNRLNAQEIAGAVGSFLSLNTGQIAWDNAAGNNAFIGNLVNEQLFTTSLLASRGVFAPDNMLSWQPQTGNITPYAASNGTTLTAFQDSDLGWVYRVQGGSSTDGNLVPCIDLRSGRNASNGGGGAFDVEAGKAYVFRVGWGLGGTFPSGVTRTIRFRVAWYDAANNQISSVFTPSSTGGGFDSRVTWCEGRLQAPALATAMRVWVDKNWWSDGALYLTGGSIRPAIGSVLIEDGAVTADKIVANAITAREMAVGAITADKAIIANSAIKSAMIAEANILTAHIDNLAVTNAKIANTTITNAKILNLDAGKITTGFLDAARIQANSIVTSKLAATAIDGMTITGSTIQTSSSANTGIKIDTANGLRAWAGGNLGVQISPSIKNGMAVRNPVGEMVPLSDAAFGTVSIARSNSLALAAPQTSGAWSQWTRHSESLDDCVLTFTAVSTSYIVSWSQSWATSYNSTGDKQTGVQVGLSTGGSGNLISSGNGGQITGLVGYLQERSADVGDRVRSVTMQGPLSTVVGQTYTLRMYFRYNANGPGTHNISVAARTITATPVY